MEKPKKQINFYLIALGILFFVGLLIALHLPEIQSWRVSVSDRLLAKAEAANNSSEKYGWLMQANILNQKDPPTVAATAQYWKENGEVAKAIETYENGINNPNNLYLANLALSDQNYNLALNLYKKASKDKKSSESLTGEAVALYNLDKVNDGCEKSSEANKLNLDNKDAQKALQVCSILGWVVRNDLDTKEFSQRQAAYLLLNSRVYRQAETKLNELQDKLAQDWLELAKLAAARGEMKLAVERAEKAVEADEVNYEVNQFLLKLYLIENNKEKIEHYKSRVEQIEKLRSIK